MDVIYCFVLFRASLQTPSDHSRSLHLPTCTTTSSSSNGNSSSRPTSGSSKSTNSSSSKVTHPVTSSSRTSIPTTELNGPSTLRASSNSGSNSSINGSTLPAGELRGSSSSSSSKAQARHLLTRGLLSTSNSANPGTVSSNCSSSTNRDNRKDEYRN